MANNTSKAETQDKTAKKMLLSIIGQLKPGTPEFDMKKDFIKDEITGKVKRYFGKTIAKAGDMEVYRAAALTIRDEIMEKWVSLSGKNVRESRKKELYYLSFEFLMAELWETI